MNTFGRIFRVSIFGESHGASIGVNIDGCPAGLKYEEKGLLQWLDRRKSGAKGTTTRVEQDLPEVVSGLFNGYTTGSPITVLFQNKNVRSKDYSKLLEHPRPGHADFVSIKKFKGFADYRGGGHFSGRLTLALVVAGYFASRIIPDVILESKLIEVGGCSDIHKAIDEAILAEDSVGGIVECKVTGIPVGLGEPFFDSVESMISHLVFSIPAIKGIEFGAGFGAAKMRGSDHNDRIINGTGCTETNYSGGINGGIANGNEMVFRVAVKPASSIAKVQNTFNLKNNKMESLQIQGRHDTCIALRVPVVIEAVSAIAIADFFMLNGK